ncbi:hypothetical protein KUTeg_024394 [Tegillarca granosa]|uniref:Uncharacterized protein n=1 Tax=Tegillarca granosa TaxID=220873 RepID=A0ABQ9DX71_TEGGR|nr:hypothetical protein KUTeg_024394 [Tegillarca granosa]
MDRLRFGYYFISFCSIIKLMNCACTFPGELTGTWYSSHKGNVQFNSSFLTGYSIYMSATVSSLDFQCEEKDGDLYMLKATEAVFAFGNWIDSYLCIELHRVSEYKYYYYLGTTTNGDYIYGRSVGTAVTMSLACNRQTPYEQGTFVTLVKDGAVVEGLADATCPSSLLAYFYNVTITNSDGTSSCTGSIADGCSTSSTLQYTYNSCATSLKFSSGGMFFCLHSYNQ